MACEKLGRHRGAEARRVLPRHRLRAQPHREPPAVGRHDGHGHRRHDAVHARHPRARVHQRICSKSSAARASPSTTCASAACALGSAAGLRQARSTSSIASSRIIDEFNDLISCNKIYIERLANVAVVPREDGDRLQPGRAEPARLGRQVRRAARRAVLGLPRVRVRRAGRHAARWARSATASTATWCACARCRRAVKILRQALDEMPDGR